MHEGRGEVGASVAPLTVLGDLWGPLGTQKIIAAKPKHKGKKEMVRVRRRIFRGEE